MKTLITAVALSAMVLTVAPWAIASEALDEGPKDASEAFKFPPPDVEEHTMFVPSGSDDSESLQPDVR